MRIGVVCEGPTDALAFEHFVAASMGARGISVEFVRLQPEKDNTQGGWTNVLKWLDNNRPSSRVSYFKGGLFRGGLAAKRCDLILMHLDSDVLSLQDFREYMRTEHDWVIDEAHGPVERGAQTSSAIEKVARLAELADKDAARHMTAPAVESTEAWCVGIFHRARVADVETLRGDELRDAFMDILHQSESRRQRGPYAQIDKSVGRRRRFCEKHAVGFRRLEAQCYQYRRLVEQIDRNRGHP